MSKYQTIFGLAVGANNPVMGRKLISTAWFPSRKIISYIVRVALYGLWLKSLLVTALAQRCVRYVGLCRLALKMSWPFNIYVMKLLLARNWFLIVSSIAHRAETSAKTSFDVSRWGENAWSLAKVKSKLQNI